MNTADRIVRECSRINKDYVAVLATIQARFPGAKVGATHTGGGCFSIGVELTSKKYAYFGVDGGVPLYGSFVGWQFDAIDDGHEESAKLEACENADQLAAAIVGVVEVFLCEAGN